MRKQKKSPTHVGGGGIYKKYLYCITWLIKQTLNIESKNHPINPSKIARYFIDLSTGISPKPRVEKTFRLNEIASIILIIKNKMKIIRNILIKINLIYIFFFKEKDIHSLGETFNKL